MSRFKTIILFFCISCLSPKIRELEKENKIQKDIDKEYKALKNNFVKHIYKKDKKDGKDCWDEFLRIYDLVRILCQFFLKKYNKTPALIDVLNNVNSWLITINGKSSIYIKEYIKTLNAYNELYNNPLYKKYMDNKMVIFVEKNNLRSKGRLDKLLKT